MLTVYRWIRGIDNINVSDMFEFYRDTDRNTRVADYKWNIVRGLRSEPTLLPQELPPNGTNYQSKWKVHWHYPVSKQTMITSKQRNTENTQAKKNMLEFSIIPPEEVLEENYIIIINNSNRTFNYRQMDSRQRIWTMTQMYAGMAKKIIKFVL